MADWTLEKESREKEHKELMARRRKHRFGDGGGFYQPGKYDRSYNMERCIYVTEYATKEDNNHPKTRVIEKK